MWRDESYVMPDHVVADLAARVRAVELRAAEVRRRQVVDDARAAALARARRRTRDQLAAVRAAIDHRRTILDRAVEVFRELVERGALVHDFRPRPRTEVPARPMSDAEFAARYAALGWRLWR